MAGGGHPSGDLQGRGQEPGQKGRGGGRAAGLANPILQAALQYKALTGGRDPKIPPNRCRRREAKGWPSSLASSYSTSPSYSWQECRGQRHGMASIRFSFIRISPDLEERNSAHGAAGCSSYLCHRFHRAAVGIEVSCTALHCTIVYTVQCMLHCLLHH